MINFKNFPLRLTLSASLSSWICSSYARRILDLMIMLNRLELHGLQRRNNIISAHKIKWKTHKKLLHELWLTASN